MTRTHEEEAVRLRIGGLGVAGRGEAPAAPIACQAVHHWL
jgi:hypothetical protein